MKTRSYKDVIAWQKSMELVKTSYQVAAKLPESEKYGLCSQTTRSAVSIPSNIAEGYRRNSRQEYIHFCGISAGSAAELETQLIVISQIYPDIREVNDALKLVSEVQKILYSLIEGLKRSPSRFMLHAVR
jgi:four helix bundle protein